MKLRTSTVTCNILIFCGLAFVLVEGVLAAPKQVIRPEEFDFGYIPEGLPVVHRYWVVNLGDEKLRIRRVRPGCGCTTVPLPKNELVPGDSVPLDLKFDPKKFRGRVNKSATVESNDSTKVGAKLHFTAIVGQWQGWVKPIPEMVYLDTLGKSEQVIKLTNTSLGEYKISILAPPADHLQFELAATEVKAKSEVDAYVRITPKSPIGEFNSSVTLRFEGPESHTVTIPIFGVGYQQ